MRKTIAPLTAIALLALAAPAGAAKTQTYKGKTSSGHKITIKVKRNKIRYIVGGVRMACVSIQGGGRPIAGSDIFGLKGTMPIKRFQSYSVMGKPAFHWKEVTQKHDLWLKKRGRRISGRMRLQYSFLIPKYPIGTFTIYSCAGGAKFKATRR
jgi:hypothetical protein